jgi:hypothetical protein
MKTKEEIEQLALNHANEEIEVYNSIGVSREIKQAIYTHCLVSYNIAYTQCQEDNKDKEYTEEDLRNAINETINACNIAQKESYGELEIDADKIINSLNKQD